MDMKRYGLKSCALSRWKGNPVRIRNNRHYCIWREESGRSHWGTCALRRPALCGMCRCIISQDTCRVFWGETQLWWEECSRFIEAWRFCVLFCVKNCGFPLCVLSDQSVVLFWPFWLKEFLLCKDETKNCARQDLECRTFASKDPNNKTVFIA